MNVNNVETKTVKGIQRFSFFIGDVCKTHYASPSLSQVSVSELLDRQMSLNGKT